MFRAPALPFGHPGSVLHGLGGEIGESAGQLQRPVVGTGREPHLAHCRTEQGLAGLVQGGMLAQLFRTQMSVGQEWSAGSVCRSQPGIMEE